MKIEEILTVDFSGKSILIIGCPASGKTHVSNIISDEQHNVIHSDDYMKFGFEQSMYKCLEDVLSSSLPAIVEGVQCYRMLRKGVELKNYYPDIVIEMKISEERQKKTYSDERDFKKVKYLQGFNHSMQKILNDYFQMPNEKKPEWIVIENDY